jgi:hypothetical protein
MTKALCLLKDMKYIMSNVAIRMESQLFSCMAVLEGEAAKLQEDFLILNFIGLWYLISVGVEGVSLTPL